MRRCMPSNPLPLPVFLAVLLVPAAGGAQQRQDGAGTPATPVADARPAPPADVAAGAPARATSKSRSLLGQAMAELTRSLDATQGASAKAPATAPAPAPGAPPREPQVAVQEPVD